MHRITFCALKKNGTVGLLIMAIAFSAITGGILVSSYVSLSSKNPSMVFATEKISTDLLNKIWSQKSGDINVLVETFDKNYKPVISLIEGLGGSVGFKYNYVKGLAAKLPANKILALAQDDHVKKIYMDEMRYPLTAIYPRMPLLDDGRLPVYLVDRNRFDDRPRFNRISLGKNHLSEADEILSMEDTLTITLTQEQIGMLEPNTYWNPVAMDAIDVWSSGDYGQDSLVVVIDTGIYPDHFMLRGSVIGGVDLSPDVGTDYEGWNLTTNHWHGTHVAGIIAGHGAILVHASHPLYRSISMYATPPQEASSFGYPGYYIIPLLGMAPGSALYAIKVFPHTGAGVLESYILDAIEYAINMTLEWGYDVDVVSMSLGGPTLFDGRDLEDTLVDYATSVGITLVAAAGNEGPASMTVSSPGSAESAITVAAAAHPVNTRVFWDYYFGEQGIGWQLFTSDVPQIYAFSSRGPTSDGRDKPDIAATGLFVLSAYIEPEWPQGVAFASGTSMSTPAVSGAVALLNTYAEAYIPEATPLDYKQAIENGAVGLDGYDEYDQGGGYLNASKALTKLTQDTSIGDVYPPLPSEYSLPDISNIPIAEEGSYEGAIGGLRPGMGQEYIFSVTNATSSITLEITDVSRNKRNPYDMNSFEIYIQSAKRTIYGYWIDTANVWGNAQFVITDYGTTWSGAVTGVYQDPCTITTAIEPGYVKIVIENDWTSSGPLSCNFKIDVTAAPTTPDETYSGTVANEGWTAFTIEPPAGTEKATLELWWQNDWSKYPTSDLDMYIKWFNETDWIWEPFVEGATLNSPERVVIETPAGVTISEIKVYINGYAIYTGEPEPWTLEVYYG